MPNPTYEEWINACFVEVVPRRSWNDYDARYLDNKTACAYITRLITEAPATLAEHYTDQQIANAFMFIFTAESELTRDLLQDEDLDIRAKTKLIELLPEFYKTCLDNLCNDRGRQPRADYCAHSDQVRRLDLAVAMFWICPGLDQCFSRENENHLGPLACEAIETALFKCETATCKYSALSGIMEAAPGDWGAKQLKRFVKNENEPKFLLKFARFLLGDSKAYD